MKSTIVRSIAFAVATNLVAAAAPALATADAQPGDQSRWSLDFTTRMEQHSAPSIEVHLTGNWTSTITAVRPGELDEQLQLADLHFKGDVAKSAPASAVADLRERLSQPFWVTSRSDGGLVSIHFLRDSRPSDRNLLEMIATELQLVRPDSARTSWTAQERDGAGEYSALYLMPQPDRILKRKLKYLYTDGVSGTPAESLHISIEQSNLTFSLNPGGLVQAVDGANRVGMKMASDQAEPLAAVTEFHMANLETGRAPELIGSLERARPNLTTSAIVTQRPDAAQVRAETDERLLNGIKTDALLAAVFSKDESTVPAGSAVPSDRLTALFRNRPDAAPAAAALLIKNGMKSDTRRKVTNALGASGSASATTTLSKLAHDATVAVELRVDAIVAFVQMQHPAVEAMRVPGDLLLDPNPRVQLASRMTAGALSRTGRAEHPAEADAIDASLASLYKSAHDLSESIQLMGALGNSAGPSLVPVIQEALRDSRVPLRAAAARALRLAAGAEIDATLVNVITTDRDPAVRADAIFATRFRRPLPAPLADALIHAASNDESTSVRSDAVTVMLQNPEASKQIPQALTQIAQYDINAGIRRQAKEALAALSQAPSTRP